MKRRLIIVSNRLPLTIEQNEGKAECRQSSGGLVSAVNAYLNNSGKDAFSERLWCGIPGCSERVWEQVSRPQTDYIYLPVFLKKKLYELYYNGFSNSILWPLFHYFPSFVEYSQAYFNAYREANAAFAAELAGHIKPGDTVWIHDYHLLLLPFMLRSMFPELSVGFFLHIPFPSYELFRVLPKQWQQEMLAGMLGADMVGFHTADYAAHFISCVKTVLPVDTDESNNTILSHGRYTGVGNFPISIDYDLFNNAYDDHGIKMFREQYLRLKGERKFIFSVDRLDYTKGISNRLKGYEQFLNEYPQFREKVVFILNIVPSRDSIAKYAERKKMIDEYIGKLNSTLGSITWQPVIYRYNHLPFNELVALYSACDIALITPLRDGMNLVAKEFVASRKDRSGVLILSELAGSARELTEALLINPNDTQEIAAMLHRAIKMSAQEQEERMVAMRAKIAKYSVNTWAADFLGGLSKINDRQPRSGLPVTDTMVKDSLIQEYASSERRLILLDYDGTLVPLKDHPDDAAPADETLQILKQLAACRRNDVCVISGRDAGTLERWLGHLPVMLIVEHGAKRRLKDGIWKDTNGDSSWIGGAEEIMSRYSHSCPGSFTERKEYSVAWHYRMSKKEDAAAAIGDMNDELREYAAAHRLQLLNGNKVIELRRAGVNKGEAITALLTANTYQFILCAGDDRTDEDMFRKLTGYPGAYTIKVGNGHSFAHYNIQTPHMLQSLLHTMSLYRSGVSVLE